MVVIPAEETGGDTPVVTTAGGRRLAYREAGAGPDMLLIHGTLMTADDMRLALFDGLRDEFRMVAVDRPSHGLSDRVPAADASLWSQAATLRDAALALGMERPIVCGHSYGGAVALAMAMAFPDLVAGVVALAPVCFPEIRPELVLFGPRVLTGSRLGAWADPLLLPLLWNAMFLPQLMPGRFAAHFPFALAGRPEMTLAEGESATYTLADLLRSVTGYAACRVPARFLAGSADIVVNPLHSLLAAAMMPNAECGLLPGVGHMLHHSNAGDVIAAVRSLAERTSASRSP